MFGNDQTNYSAFIHHTAAEFGQMYFVYSPGEHCFHYINPGFQQVWQKTPDQFLQDPAALLAFIHPEDYSFVVLEFTKLLSKQQPITLEFRIKPTEHETKWICVNAHLVTDSTTDQPLISGFAYDITVAKVNVSTLQKFNAKKDATLEILSHDLASPFRNIEGLIEVLEEQLDIGDEQVSQLIQLIKGDAKKGSDLIRDFVNQEFLESSQITINKERVNIAYKIAAMMDSYQNGVTLIPKQFDFVPYQEPVFIMVDDLKFMQVLNNLISNAIKFTPDHGRIMLTLEDQENTILITISDNGIGIPAKYHASLFDKFTNARRPGIRGEKSVGLGMSIIKTIIELHQGKIWFESQENIGSTFYIQMPKE